MFLSLMLGFLTTMGWTLWRRRTTSRRLVYLANRLELAIQTIRNGEDFVSEARRPISECALSLHPVRLGRSSRGIWIGFTGWMVRATVDNRCFALACVSEKEKAVEYLQQVPSWLLALYTGEGEQVIGCLSDRTLGRK